MKDNKITNWFEKYKTKFIIVGGVIVTTIGTIILIDNWALVSGLFVNKTKKLQANSIDFIPDIPTFVAGSEPIQKTIDVREHLRNLPQGYHPSAQKIAKAVELGIKLETNQTIVSAHSRYCVA